LKLHHLNHFHLLMTFLLYRYNYTKWTKYAFLCGSVKKKEEYHTLNVHW
jgi:hypothetical protein